MTPTANTLSHPIVLSPRDLDILESLSIKGYRFMSRGHLTMLYFPSLLECSTRMNELCEFGFVTQLFMPTVSGEKPEPIYTLTRSGTRELARLRHLNVRQIMPSIRKPSFFFLEHSLKVTTFMCSLKAALSKTAITLSRWDSEYALRSSRHKALRVPDPINFGEKIPIIPDGLFALEDNGITDYFFLEADRGTMSMAAIRKKMLGYIQLFRKGIHKQVFNLPYFRVLFVTTTPYRRIQASMALKELGRCPNMFLFTTWQDINPNSIIGNIWHKCNSSNLFSIFD